MKTFGNQFIVTRLEQTWESVSAATIDTPTYRVPKRFTMVTLEGLGNERVIVTVPFDETPKLGDVYLMALEPVRLQES